MRAILLVMLVGCATSNECQPPATRQTPGAVTLHSELWQTMVCTDTMCVPRDPPAEWRGSWCNPANLNADSPLVCTP